MRRGGHSISGAIMRKFTIGRTAGPLILARGRKVQTPYVGSLPIVTLRTAFHDGICLKGSFTFDARPHKEAWVWN